MPVEEQIKVSLVGEDAGLGAATVTGSKNLDRFGKSIDDVNKKLPQLSRQSGTATQSMINLSRIAQDAPYGFIGIANNLNPMLESFQRLQVEAGGSQAALKAMVGALAGPAGIGLALGVVSSLLVTFGKDIFGAGKETEDAGHKFDFFTDKINDVKDALADVNTQIDQMAKLGSINIEINGLNKSLDLEGQVVDLAQKAANARKAYSDMGDTILEIQSKLDESGKNGKLLVTGKDRDDLEAKLKQATDAQRKANEDAIKYEGERVVAERSVALQKKKEREDAAKDADEAHKKDIAALKRRNKEILDEEKRAAKERHDLLASLRSANIDFNSPTDFFKNLNLEEAQKSNPDYEKFLRNQFSNIKIPARINIVPSTTPLIDTKGLQVVDGIALAAKANDEITKAFQNIQVDGFVALGDAIGKALTGGNLGEAFAALGAQLGTVITQLGEQMIQLGVLALATSNAIKSALTNPFLLIAAGVALTAFGSVIQSKLSVPHLAQGGIIPPGYSGDKFPAMLNSGEAVIPLDKIGSVLGGVGGGGPQVIVMAQRLRGRDAVLQQVREGKSQRRGA
jgi:hypothetical protein